MPREDAHRVYLRMRDAFPRRDGYTVEMVTNRAQGGMMVQIQDGRTGWFYSITRGTEAEIAGAFKRVTSWRQRGGKS